MEVQNEKLWFFILAKYKVIWKMMLGMWKANFLNWQAGAIHTEYGLPSKCFINRGILTSPRWVMMMLEGRMI